MNNTTHTLKFSSIFFSALRKCARYVAILIFLLSFNSVNFWSIHIHHSLILFSVPALVMRFTKNGKK
jgi:hypothetical protein